MRYADGPTARAEVLVDAPIERVWALVSDIEVPARFSEELVAVRWLDDERGVGARFVGTNQHESIGEWEMTNHVVRCEPNRVFEWAVHDPAQPASRFGCASRGGWARARTSCPWSSRPCRRRKSGSSPGASVSTRPTWP